MMVEGKTKGACQFNCTDSGFDRLVIAGELLVLFSD